MNPEKEMRLSLILVVAVVALLLVLLVNCAPTPTPTPTPPPCPAEEENWENFGPFVRLEVPTASGVVSGSIQQFVDESSLAFAFEEGEPPFVFPPCVVAGLTIGNITLDAYIDLNGDVHLSPDTAMYVVPENTPGIEA